MGRLFWGAAEVIIGSSCRSERTAPQMVGAPTKTTQQERGDGLEMGKMPKHLPALVAVISRADRRGPWVGFWGQEAVWSPPSQSRLGDGKSQPSVASFGKVHFQVSEL